MEIGNDLKCTFYMMPTHCHLLVQENLENAYNMMLI